jgi:predicted DNA binding CopG/RHH family protein
MNDSANNRMPTFQSLDEEAAWWDQHASAELQDQLTTIPARFAKNLSAGINVRLEPDHLAELRDRASEIGVGPSTLVRMWILERLRQSSGA